MVNNISKYITNIVLIAIFLTLLTNESISQIKIKSIINKTWIGKYSDGFETNVKWKLKLNEDYTFQLDEIVKHQYKYKVVKVIK